MSLKSLSVISVLLLFHLVLGDWIRTAVVYYSSENTTVTVESVVATIAHPKKTLRERVTIKQTADAFGGIGLSGRNLIANDLYLYYLYFSSRQVVK